MSLTAPSITNDCLVVGGRSASVCWPFDRTTSVSVMAILRHSLATMHFVIFSSEIASFLINDTRCGSAMLRLSRSWANSCRLVLRSSSTFLGSSCCGGPPGSPIATSVSSPCTWATRCGLVRKCHVSVQIVVAADVCECKARIPCLLRDHHISPAVQHGTHMHVK